MEMVGNKPAATSCNLNHWVDRTTIFTLRFDRLRRHCVARGVSGAILRVGEVFGGDRAATESLLAIGCVQTSTRRPLRPAVASMGLHLGQRPWPNLSGPRELSLRRPDVTSAGEFALGTSEAMDPAGASCLDMQ